MNAFQIIGGKPKSARLEDLSVSKSNEEHSVGVLNLKEAKEVEEIKSFLKCLESTTDIFEEARFFYMI